MTTPMLDLRPAGWPFGDIPAGQAHVVLCDPPWLFKNWSPKGEIKNPLAHYPCEGTASLAKLPVADLAAPNAVMVMWATAPMVEDAYWLMRAWGFTPKTMGTWAKLSKTGEKLAFGTGYVYRSAAEFFILGKRGKPKARDTSAARSVRNLLVDGAITGLLEWAIAAPVREHSRKPDEMYAAIETLFHGPYVELFARQSWPGWAAWGNQSDKFTASDVGPCLPVNVLG